MVFQQHQDESLYDTWTRFKKLIQRVPHHGLDLWSLAQFFCDHVNRYTQIDIDHAAGGNLKVLSAEEEWETIEDCAQCDKQWKNLTSTIPDQTIANLMTQLVENEVVRVKIPKCVAWLDDEPIRDLNTMEDKVDNLSPQSTLQVLLSFEAYTLPVTHPEKVEETIGTPIEVEPLNETKLKEVGLNCNHNTPLSSREVPSFDGPEPQPLLNSPSLDVSLGDVIGPEPPIKPHSPDSSRMKVVDYLTTQTPPSPHVANSHPKGVYSYYNPGINDPKRHYGFKPGLLGKSVSLGVDISNWEMFDDDWGLESKEVSPLGKELSLFDRPNEVERGRILEAYHLELILQQQISQRMAPSHHNVIFDEKKLGRYELVNSGVPIVDTHQMDLMIGNRVGNEYNHGKENSLNTRLIITSRVRALRSEFEETLGAGTIGADASRDSMINSYEQSHYTRDITSTCNRAIKSADDNATERQRARHNMKGARTAFLVFYVLESMLFTSHTESTRSHRVSFTEHGTLSEFRGVQSRLSFAVGERRESLFTLSSSGRGLYGRDTTVCFSLLLTITVLSTRVTSDIHRYLVRLSARWDNQCDTEFYGIRLFDVVWEKGSDNSDHTGILGTTFKDNTDLQSVAFHTSRTRQYRAMLSGWGTVVLSVAACHRLHGLLTDRCESSVRVIDCGRIFHLAALETVHNEITSVIRRRERIEIHGEQITQENDCTWIHTQESGASDRSLFSYARALHTDIVEETHINQILSLSLSLIECCDTVTQSMRAVFFETESHEWRGVIMDDEKCRQQYGTGMDGRRHDWSRGLCGRRDTVGCNGVYTVRILLSSVEIREKSQCTMVIDKFCRKGGTTRRHSETHTYGAGSSIRYRGEIRPKAGDTVTQSVSLSVCGGLWGQHNVTVTVGFGFRRASDTLYRGWSIEDENLECIWVNGGLEVECGWVSKTYDRGMICFDITMNKRRHSEGSRDSGRDTENTLISLAVETLWRALSIKAMSKERRGFISKIGAYYRVAGGVEGEGLVVGGHTGLDRSCSGVLVSTDTETECVQREGIYGSETFCTSSGESVVDKTDVEGGMELPQSIEFWYSAFGMHLEEIHMTWAWRRNRQDYEPTPTSQEFLLRGWRRRHRLHGRPSESRPTTASQDLQDGVRMQ
ncbi:hypothetical protein Tco_0017078 [Tanacetum coccineum]